MFSTMHYINTNRLTLYNSFTYRFTQDFKLSSIFTNWVSRVYKNANHFDYHCFNGLTGIFYWYGSSRSTTAGWHVVIQSLQYWLIYHSLYHNIYLNLASASNYFTYTIRTSLTIRKLVKRSLVKCISGKLINSSIVHFG